MAVKWRSLVAVRLPMLYVATYTKTRQSNTPAPIGRLPLSNFSMPCGYDRIKIRHLNGQRLAPPESGILESVAV